MYTQGGHVHAGVAGGSCAHMGGRGVMHTQGWQGGHVHAGVARGSCAHRGGRGVTRLPFSRLLPRSLICGRNVAPYSGAANPWAL